MTRYHATFSGPCVKWSCCHFHLGSSHDRHFGIINGTKLKSTKVVCDIVAWNSYRVSRTSISWFRCY